jgi:hypothetical protein
MIRRGCRGRDLDQVETFLARDRERLRRRHDAELLPVLIDDPDFPYPDPFVDPRAVVPPRASIESDINPLPNQRQ